MSEGKKVLGTWRTADEWAEIIAAASVAADIKIKRRGAMQSGYSAKTIHGIGWLANAYTKYPQDVRRRAGQLNKYEYSPSLQAAKVGEVTHFYRDKHDDATLFSWATEAKERIRK